MSKPISATKEGVLEAFMDVERMVLEAPCEEQSVLAGRLDWDKGYEVWVTIKRVEE